MNAVSLVSRSDVLVNNAGIMLVAPLHAMAKADFEEAMQIHFWAPYNVTMAALPYLRRNSESRIVISRQSLAELRSPIWRLLCK
jgi:NAD(P)-dependent dehydrogenase (short-subunit alcohol dehydrogenase family)